MKKIAILIVSIILFQSSYGQVTGPKGERFNVRVVASKLSDPWSVVYGPDKHLWLTESKGYRVSRVEPGSGRLDILLDLNKQREFPRYDKLGKQTGGKPWPQGGLTGLALHPQLLNGKPFVYLVYTYRFAGTDSSGNGCLVKSRGCFFTGRLVRYTYDKTHKQLQNPVIICDTLPHSNDHNGGRLLIAPINGKLSLFYSLGDLGAGQFSNIARPNHAQQQDSYEGKILRFNLEADGDANVSDSWIPNDNPFNRSKQSAVWTYGHRNPQGLAYANINGRDILYQSEHGPFSDDELNIIEKGKNYGHPLVIGYADGNYNGLSAGVSNNPDGPGKWHSTYPVVASEQENARALGTAFHGPLFSFNASSHTYLKELFGKLSQGKRDEEWPSVAPSSLAVYTSNTIPGWKYSLLVPTLKAGKLIRVKLNTAGNRVTGDTLSYFKGSVRFRDIAICPEGDKIYLITDSTSVTSGPSKDNPQQISHRGSLLEYTYVSKPAGEMEDKRKQSPKRN